MKDVSFREAEESDIEELVRCWSDFMGYNLREGDSETNLWEMTGDSSEKWHSHIKEMIEEEDSLVLLAEKNDEIVGYAVASLEDRPPIFKKRKIGKLDELFVKDRYRKKGLGKELVERAENWLKEKGVDLLKVRVLEDNETADRFWDSCGYADNIKIKFKEFE